MPVIAVAQFTIRDTNDITASAVAPVSPVENELWLDLSITPNQLKRYTGSAWIIVNDSADIISAVQAARADIEALAIGGRNLIWGTLNPGTNPGYRPAINGYRDTGTEHSGTLEYYGELVHSTGTLEAVEHGVMISTTTVMPIAPYLRFGNAWTSGGSLLGLAAGQTYTFSGDVEMKLLSKYAGSSTIYVYATLYHAAEGSTSFTTGSTTAGTRYTLGSYTKATAGSLIRKRMEWTFTIPAGTVAVYFNFASSSTTGSYFQNGDYLSISNMKLERGNRATDWTAAPEDTEEELEEKLTAVNARISNEGDSIRQEVQATYALASDMTQVRSQVGTLSEQTQNNYTWAVTRVNQLQDDLNTAREATEEELAVMRSYMTFGEDGLSIGKTGNPFTFRVANDRLAFFMNETEVAYLSNNKLYVTQAEILTRLIIGKLAFEPQTNGNLSLVFRG